jgi:hypothetical protein
MKGLKRWIVRLTQDGQPLPVDQLDGDAKNGGVILGGEMSAWPRGLGFTLRGLGDHQKNLERLRLENNLEKHQHRITLTRDDSGALVFESMLPERLPIGAFACTLKISGLKIRNSEFELIVNGDAEEQIIELKVRKDQGRFELSRPLSDFDPQIADVLKRRSELDGLSGAEWLNAPGPRLQRKACLLNLLARLRAIETTDTTLLSFVDHIFLADADRIYARVDRDFLAGLVDLARGGSFTTSGPVGAIHRRILQKISGPGAAEYEFVSFRQNTHPSLQAVIAFSDAPGRAAYADVDLDLGNPLLDVSGFLVHLGEVIAPGQTDHIRLRSRLADDPATAPFMYYKVR